jgi:hypothetical protein
MLTRTRNANPLQSTGAIGFNAERWYNGTGVEHACCVNGLVHMRST